MIKALRNMPESSGSDDQLPSVDKSSPQMWTRAIVVAVVVILILVGIFAAAGVKLADNLASQMAALGGVLTLVALLVERVTEVFVSIWRDPAADLLEQQRDSYGEQQEIDRQAVADLNKELRDESPDQSRKDAIAQQKATYRNDLPSYLDKIKKIDLELVPYKAKTRRLASLVGIGIGVLASGVGFRMLQSLVDGTSFNGLPWPQKNLFCAADVLLTGTVLAGGSIAVHQVFSLYDTFMESSRQRVGSSK
jgi:hypothetical protein